ncbi:MAG: HAMP domain-containing sensor histidine kinase [Candidatus Gracilibacteria bacterium]|nr:HAMP domain-containing sensor histidine kinase [Candidatus Gracilibacteria bacterium]
MLKISNVQIKLFDKYSKEKNEIYHFFLKNISSDLFINDIVFVEENKNKFNYDKIKEYISNASYLIFPLINNKSELVGTFELGYRPLKELYKKEEIDILKKFAEFIVGQIKYIEIYSKINDLNINLDKKVDKKTMQYNQLLNKQTEFISMASHEIKSPLGTSIFQLDYIIDEISEGNFTIDDIKKELSLLNNTLIKVGNLTNKIFTVQKYDLDKVKLYIQKIEIVDLLEDLLQNFISSNKNIRFDYLFPKKQIYINIDQIQFTQVIDNLITNAIKFASKKEPQIIIKLSDLGNDIKITIEDNGIGFKYNEARDIFEKYRSGNKSVGLGLGLYLCKRIVELHNGTIEASNSKNLGGAKFTIIIPKK